MLITVGWVWWRHQRAPLFSLASGPPHLNPPLLVGTSRAKNKFPRHLQTTLLQIGYCNQYKFFHFDFFTVNLNIHRFFAWSTSAECSELYCNAQIKTVNGDVPWLPQKQGMVARHIKANYTCFKVRGNKVACIVKPHTQYNIVSLHLPHFLHSLHFLWALFKAVAGISPFSTWNN